MRITRLVACTAIAGFAGLTPVAIAAPSQAADTYKTFTVASPSDTSVVPRWDAQAGAFTDDTLSIDVDLDSDTGFAPTGGTATLMARKGGSTEWVALAESTTSSPDFSAVDPTVTTTYMVAYDGFTAPDGDVYAPSESDPFTVRVARRITYPVAGFVIKGKVKPNYREKKIVIKVSKQQNSGYKFFRTITTSSRGRYTITLPRRGGTRYWSFAVKGDARYLANGFVWKTFVG